jgi:quercetin dioxygenase-like cupin family protein
MAIFHVYTGDDGDSHVEELTVGGHPILAEALSAATIQFNEVSTDFVNDWHTAPQRLVVMMLEGQIELGFKDGPRVFNPGDAILVEDTTGSGHTMRIPSATPPVTAVVYLAE